ncbi:amidohydrolase family protein [Rothia amarae]|uniref:amidohydrolase family protein n=1 Tax=Rothia amarae TaxID=169480 RepID=UPI0012479D8D
MEKLITSHSLEGIALIDHHCHGVVEHHLSRPEFELMITESHWGAIAGTTIFDSQLGFAIRRWCAPVLGLEPFISAEEYISHRNEMEPAHVNELFLQQSEISHYLIETGHLGTEILSTSEMAHSSGREALTVIRLESIAEHVISTLYESSDFVTAFRRELKKQLSSAVAVKSIAAYRIGLDFKPERPSDTEVAVAVNDWLSAIKESGASPRLDDETIIRFGLWCAVDEQIPIQFHIGFGDPDIELDKCNPVLLTQFLHLTRTLGSNIMLLHCYPYHREAGYLAHAFPHVYCDIGLAINYVGARSQNLIAESLELAPFDKILFSTDAWGLPELYYLGSLLFKRGLINTLNEWIESGEWCTDDAIKVIHKIFHFNAERAYQLD